MDVVTRKRRR